MAGALPEGYRFVILRRLYQVPVSSEGIAADWFTTASNDQSAAAPSR